MFRPALAIVIACTSITLIGCAPNDGGGNAKMTAVAPTPTELAAYAARTPFPQTQPSNELRAAALVSADRSSIRIYNFTNDALADADVWVNGAWVQHVSGISANGSVTIRSVDLYNALGKNFSGQSEPVTKVQIQVGGKFFNAMGPVTQ